jgi:hypothetical protein
MTIQEKANELMSFFNTIQFHHEKNIAYTFNHLTIEEKKRCVIYVVDEIIKAIDKHECGYWEKVKKEIEKI